VIGGTITSTVLTLFVIPTIYEIFDRWRTGMSARFARRRARAEAAARRPGVTGGLAPEPAGD
jgi:HAE1 family hydrophobic/amphiphilic exporter-1